MTRQVGHFLGPSPWTGGWTCNQASHDFSPTTRIQMGIQQPLGTCKVHRQQEISVCCTLNSPPTCQNHDEDVEHATHTHTRSLTRTHMCSRKRGFTILFISDQDTHTSLKLRQNIDINAGKTSKLKVKTWITLSVTSSLPPLHPTLRCTFAGHIY